MGVWQLIHNPVSGIGDSDDDLETIRGIFGECGAELRVTLTAEGVEPVDQIEDGVDGVIASGGDGTVTAVASALAGTGIPLGVIPRGTANAFALALGLPLRLKNACEVILTGKPRTIDLARCGSRIVALLAAVGYEAEVVRAADREMKDRLGPLAYIFSGISQLVRQEPFHARLESGDQVLELPAFAITVANVAPPTSLLAQGYGGPKADDGLLDVTVVSADGKLDALGALASLVHAGLVESKADAENVRSVRVSSVRVTTEPPQNVAVDGDIIGETPAGFECLPGALKVIAE